MGYGAGTPTSRLRAHEPAAIGRVAEMEDAVRVVRTEEAATALGETATRPELLGTACHLNHLPFSRERSMCYTPVSWAGLPTRN